MANITGIKRRIGGTQVAPTGANIEGELAIFFPGTAGGTDKPTLYANDGGGWRVVNEGSGGVSPFNTTTAYKAGEMVLQGNNIYTATGAIGAGAFNPGQWTKITNTVTPSVVGITAGPDQGSVQATFNTDAINVVPGEIAIYTYNGTAYVYTGSTGSPVTGATAAQFTSLGAATPFASAIEAAAGTDTGKAVNSQVLRTELARALGPVTAGLIGAGTAVTTTPDATPANDANKLVALDATGKIDSGFLSVGAVHFKGSVDITAAPTGAAGTPAVGDLYFNTTSGAANAGWTGVTGSHNAGTMLIWDGANWNAIAPDTDLTGVTHFHENVDFTAAPSATVPLAKGDIYKAGTVGTINAGWTGLGTLTPPAVGDVLIYDGTTFSYIYKPHPEPAYYDFGYKPSYAADIGAAWTKAAHPAPLPGQYVEVRWGVYRYLLKNNAAPATAASWIKIDDQQHHLDTAGFGQYIFTCGTGAGKDFATIEEAVDFLNKFKPQTDPDAWSDPVIEVHLDSGGTYTPAGGAGAAAVALFSHPGNVTFATASGTGATTPAVLNGYGFYITNHYCMFDNVNFRDGDVGWKGCTRGLTDGFANGLAGCGGTFNSIMASSCDQFVFKAMGTVTVTDANTGSIVSGATNSHGEAVVFESVSDGEITGNINLTNGAAIRIQNSHVRGGGPAPGNSLVLTTDQAGSTYTKTLPAISLDHQSSLWIDNAASRISGANPKVAHLACLIELKDASHVITTAAVVDATMFGTLGGFAGGVGYGNMDLVGAGWDDTVVPVNYMTPQGGIYRKEANNTLILDAGIY